MAARFIALLAFFRQYQSEFIVVDPSESTISCSGLEDCTIQCESDGTSPGNGYCEGKKLYCPPDPYLCEVECDGPRSCYNADIEWSSIGSLSLFGDKAASNIIFPEPDPSTPLNIDCNSIEACEYSTIFCPEDADCTVKCGGLDACRHTTIQCPINANCDIECSDDSSCESAIIQCPENGDCNLDCSGEESCYFTDITWSNDSFVNTLYCSPVACNDDIVLPPTQSPTELSPNKIISTFQDSLR